MLPAGSLPIGPLHAEGLPQNEIRLADVSFAYPGGTPVLDHFNLTVSGRYVHETNDTIFQLPTAAAMAACSGR